MVKIIRAPEIGRNDSLNLGGQIRFLGPIVININQGIEGKQKNIAFNLAACKSLRFVFFLILSHGFGGCSCEFILGQFTLPLMKIEMELF